MGQQEGNIVDLVMVTVFMIAFGWSREKSLFSIESLAKAESHRLTEASIYTVVWVFSQDPRWRVGLKTKWGHVTEFSFRKGVLSQMKSNWEIKQDEVKWWPLDLATRMSLSELVFLCGFCCCCLLGFVFLETGSWLCSPSWPRICFVDQAVLKFMVFLVLYSKCHHAVCFIFYWDRISLCTPSWLWTNNSSASDYQVLRLQTCSTIPSLTYFFNSSVQF